jgi:Lanthionine synthetase C-like protein
VTRDGDLTAVVGELLGPASDRHWHIVPGPWWHEARPVDCAPRSQGWQLYLSATPRSARAVLDRVVPLLRDDGLAFSFASSLDLVRWLDGPTCAAADFGKFLTVQPDDDAAFARIAGRLHAVTAGLPGPHIPAARAYLPGSLVHCRYRRSDVPREEPSAGFGNPNVGNQSFGNQSFGNQSFGNLDNDGIRDTSRGPGPDVSLPAGPVHADGDGRRYVIERTLSAGPTGGRYLAIDTRPVSREVVLKHARAHTDSDLSGTDARHRLLHEARMLRRLGEYVRVPRPLGMFAAAGDLFLVEERVTGQSLREWVRRRSGRSAGPPVAPALALARRLVAMVGAVHEAGLVLPGLGPDQVVVMPDGTPALVDLAGASDLAPGTTPADDAYPLGCLLFLLATGNDPVLADDDSDGYRPLHDRLAAWLAVVARYGDTARLLGPAVRTLLREDPAERDPAEGDPAEGMDLAHVDRLLSSDQATAPVCIPAGLPTGDELLADGLDHLTATLTPDGERLWPSGGFGSQTDPRNVQHGAAGVLAVLVQAYIHHVAMDPVPVGLESTVRKAASWLSAHSEHGGNPLPGLYFGGAGLAWVLADAGVALGEPHLLTQGERLALRLPVKWPNPDIAHGVAGAALLHLHLGHLTSRPSPARDPLRRSTTRSGGDSRFLDRAASCAKILSSAAVAGPHGPTWPIPTAFASRLAGASHYGFAHGVAGIGYALLALGATLNEPAYTTLAVEAGYTLCRAVRTDDDGAAWWPVGPADKTTLPHWCSGSSGVGTFLLRLFTTTGEQRFAEQARAAAGAVYRSRWTSPPSACHGLAGDGEYLLDAAAALRDPTYRAWAEDLVPLIAARHCRRGGRAVVPDETLRAVVADYNVGLAGVLGYLLRLRHGGARQFLVDDLLGDEAAGSAPTGTTHW